MAPIFPDTELLGVVTDFTHGVDLDGLLDEREVTFYPGSSTATFRRMRAHCSRRSIALVTRPGAAC